jgi:hypothetical protein
MPSRSFFDVPDQLANRAVLLEYIPDGDFLPLDKFVARGIAPLLDEASIARLIGISTRTVFVLMLNPEKHYRTFEIKKKSGSSRTIHAPRTYLKVVQWWILDNILKKFEFDTCVTGFRTGSSPLLNAQRHVGANHLLCMDLKDFFPSIDEEAVARIWSEFGYDPIVVKQLTSLTTFRGRLPQGAPTSPSLANIAAKIMDTKLTSLSQLYGYSYSRYADDLTFSAYNLIDVDFAEMVEKVVYEAGFSLNASKTRFLGRGSAMEVTGFVVNSHPQLPKKWRKNARAIFYTAISNPAENTHRINYLRGIYGAVASFTNEGNDLRRSGQQALRLVSEARRLQEAEVPTE